MTNSVSYADIPQTQVVQLHFHLNRGKPQFFRQRKNYHDLRYEF